MYVRYVCYPVEVLGPGKRLGIWLSGCLKNCPGCMSAELKSRRESDWISLDLLEDMILPRAADIEGVTISGGEPFDQVEELCGLVKFLGREVTSDILVYSGYLYSELLDMRGAPEVLSHISVLIDGEYRQEMDNGIGLRGSTNQSVITLGEGVEYDYAAASRRRQLFSFGYETIAVGLRGNNV